MSREAMTTLADAARAVLGRLEGDDATFSGISTDTRSLAAGDLFFALRGPRHDGAAYVEQALAAGAAGAVVGEGGVQPAGRPLVQVDDARLALGRLAAAWRARFRLPVVALTGSNGKTTVKEMLARILVEACGDPARVLATRGNLNNDIGVPLTLLRLRSGHRWAVVEMGMNHAGEIRYLAGLARPDVALVNNAGRAHIEHLGSTEAIARAKAEIYEPLGDDGIAVLNADDIWAPMWRAQNAGRRTVEFGLRPDLEVHGAYRDRGLESEMTLATPAGEHTFVLRAPGRHNAYNAIAAAAAAHALGIALDAICAGLAAFQGVRGRLQRRAGIRGATLIDDTYNANPESVAAAIAVLSAQPGKRVLVLGDMGELGDHAVDSHRAVGEAAKRAGLDRLLTVGDGSEAAARAFGQNAVHFARMEDLLAVVDRELDDRTTVLVKGSRFMQMERVVRVCESAGRGPTRAG